MSANDKIEMIPSDCAKHLFNVGQHAANLPTTVRESFEILHKLKMRTDEPVISNKCQELINLLFKKYPNIVACPQAFIPRPEAKP